MIDDRSEQYVLGVDVGTVSTRAGILDAAGTILAWAVEPINMEA